MADLWAEVLGTSGVGINDHFVFDLSGNSLLALQLIDRVNRRFGVRLTLPDLLTTPTVATMCAKFTSRGQGVNHGIQYLSIVRQGRSPHAVVCVGFVNSIPLLQEALPEHVPIWWLKLDGLHAPPLPHAADSRNCRQLCGRARSACGR